METKGCFQFKIIINVLVRSLRFIEYPCDESNATINMFTLTAWVSTLCVSIRREAATDVKQQRASAGSKHGSPQVSGTGGIQC